MSDQRARGMEQGSAVQVLQKYQNKTLPSAWVLWWTATLTITSSWDWPRNASSVWWKHLRFYVLYFSTLKTSPLSKEFIKKRTQSHLKSPEAVSLTWVVGGSESCGEQKLILCILHPGWVPVLKYRIFIVQEFMLDLETTFCWKCHWYQRIS